MTPTVFAEPSGDAANSFELWPTDLHLVRGLGPNTYRFKPVLVTEHGVGTDDDSLRQWLIPNALAGLHQTIADGVPVLGYISWSLVDNFEWVFGYRIKFGLCALDRTTFRRIPKPSAQVLARIARANRLV